MRTWAIHRVWTEEDLNILAQHTSWEDAQPLGIDLQDVGGPTISRRSKKSQVEECLKGNPKSGGEQCMIYSKKVRNQTGDFMQ